MVAYLFTKQNDRVRFSTGAIFMDKHQMINQIAVIRQLMHEELADFKDTIQTLCDKLS